MWCGGVAGVEEVGGCQRLGDRGAEAEHGACVDVGESRDERGECLQGGDHDGAPGGPEHELLDRGHDGGSGEGGHGGGA
jgi:hypothetical protein